MKQNNTNTMQNINIKFTHKYVKTICRKRAIVATCLTGIRNNAYLSAKTGVVMHVMSCHVMSWLILGHHYTRVNNKYECTMDQEL